MGHDGENNGIDPMDHGQPVIDVAPLRSVPYTGPLPTPIHESSVFGSNASPFPTEKAQTSANGSTQPAMIYFTSFATPEEKTDLFAATISHKKAGSLLTGTALMGKIGPSIGAIDILETDNKYLFRVSLPGVAKDADNFQCNIESDGKVDIRGITLTGVRAMHKHNMLFKMNTSNLCPPGKFTISFHLPGPTGNQLARSFGSDGILEAIVEKRQHDNL